MKLKFFLATSALALSLTVVNTPASAQGICDLTTAGESGGGASATGIGSFACGQLSVASEDFSTAIGDRALSLFGSTTLGASSTASSLSLIGIDRLELVPNDANGASTALGVEAFAVGHGTLAVGDQAGVGVYTSLGGGLADIDAVNGGTAIGSLSLVTGENGTAVGYQAAASGSNSTALGTGASTAGFAGAVALGAGSANTAANQVHVGGRTISGVTAGVAATDAVNVSQLNAAVAGVAVDISGLEAMDAILASRIGRVNDRASAGTATAIALGGMAFLPGKRFNLTGNVGTYRGAYAAALQIGAMLGENAAFNAGIATGFNKGGKMGARAGFTIGW